ncbi:MAG: HNH endonuclease family protein [Rothia sp. (in: high G+C Gram-positive bacteria)]|nr:HNH endonuclease family protein [Rothia sp. (in: high G+C Gram-positive bacteria)]
MNKAQLPRDFSFKAPTDRQVRRGARFFFGLPTGLKKLLAVITLLVLIISGLFWLHSYGWDLQAAVRGSKSGGQAVSTGFSRSGVKTYSTAADVLGTLTVAEPTDKSTYRRDRFGKPWTDTDANGCDTRNDILTRDLQQVDIGSTCRVLSGTLIDPYTAETIVFERGESSSEAVPIDHVVALSNAWRSGASTWSDEKRLELANDPLNLQATSKSANTEKSSKSADTWLPQAGYQCEYVARQVSVKAAYQLTVTASEKKAMQRVLDTCPLQPAYRSYFAG